MLALVVVGRETFRLRTGPAGGVRPRGGGRLHRRPPRTTTWPAALTHDDVRWILRADVDLLEEATDDPDAEGAEIVDEDAAVARILHRADEEDRGLDDADVAAVLAGRGAYLAAIGAVGPEVAGPEDFA